MKRTFAALGLLVLLLASPAGARVYQEKFDPSHPSVLTQVLSVGQDGQWRGEFGQFAYKMSSQGGGGAVRFFHVNGISGETVKSLANAKVSVVVGGRFDAPISGAGLIYRFDKPSHTYWAFVVHGGGGYAVYKRSADSLHKVMGGTHSAINASGPNLITAEPADGNQVRFSVNGETVATVGSSAITGHALGILAISPGSFRFSDFQVETATP